MTNKDFSLKKYNSIDEVILASWQNEDNSIILEDLKEATIGGLDINENEHEFSYEDQKEGIEKQGIWGWIGDDKVIHYWIGKELSMEELIHFFAHDIGHQTGIKDEDEFQEEMRAEGYGHTATMAYSFAKLVKTN